MADYAIRSYRPHLLTRGSDTSISMSLYDLQTGDPQSLSGGVTVEVKDDSGVVQSSGSASISGDTFTASYTVASASLTDLSYASNWRVEWSTDYGLHIESAALVRTNVHCPLIAQDLLDEDPELYHAQWRDLQGSTVPWDRFIQAAYREFYSRLTTIKSWPWKIVNPDAFRTYLINSALSRVYRSLMADDNERYQTKADYFKREADVEWGRIELLFDTAEGGTSATRAQAQPIIYLGGAPGQHTHRRY